MEKVCMVCASNGTPTMSEVSPWEYAKGLKNVEVLLCEDCADDMSNCDGCGTLMDDNSANVFVMDDYGGEGMCFTCGQSLLAQMKEEVTELENQLNKIAELYKGE